MVGFGSGVTVGATTQFPIGHVDVVELEPEVVAASRFFDDVNHRPAKNPKVNVLVGDGRNFLTQGDDKYDVKLLIVWFMASTPPTRTIRSTAS